MRVAFGLGFREMSFRVSPAGLARMRARALALPDVPDGAGSRRHGRAVPNEGNRAGVSGADRSRGDGVSVKGNRFAWRFQFPGGCDVADSGLHLGLGGRAPAHGEQGKRGKRERFHAVERRRDHRRRGERLYLEGRVRS